MKAKPMWAVIQTFDWAYEKTSLKPLPPTLQEMRSMSWQGLVAGAKGLLFIHLPICINLIKQLHLNQDGMM